MIHREWRARATPEGARGYAAHFESEVAPVLRKFPGYLGARILERSVDGVVEIAVATVWRSMDDVRAFAGADLDRAVFRPGALDHLLSGDDHVSHYEQTYADGGERPEPLC